MHMNRFFIALLTGLLLMASLATYADAQVSVSENKSARPCDKLPDTPPPSTPPDCQKKPAPNCPDSGKSIPKTCPKPPADCPKKNSSSR
jgi:hypothetical protein